MIKRALLEAGLKKHLTEDLNLPAYVHALEAGGGTATLWISMKMIPAMLTRPRSAPWAISG